MIWACRRGDLARRPSLICFTCCWSLSSACRADLLTDTIAPCLTRGPAPSMCSGQLPFSWPVADPPLVTPCPVAQGLVAARGTQVLMLECPDVAESKHSNPDKKKYLTKGIVGKHLRAMRELRSGPWHWLPLHDITRACNDGCSTDGVHSGFVVYDTVVQWLANQLRLGI